MGVKEYKLTSSNSIKSSLEIGRFTSISGPITEFLFAKN